MEERFSRTEMLLGTKAMQRLSCKRVIVFGVGGVGGYVCEALARAGVGGIDVVDDDLVVESNINRQIIATQDSVGLKKVDVAKRRVLSINPNIIVNTYDCFYLPEKRDQFDFAQCD